jgi:hypothetical protein
VGSGFASREYSGVLFLNGPFAENVPGHHQTLFPSFRIIGLKYLGHQPLRIFVLN